MSAPLDDGFFDDIDQDGFWADPAPAPTPPPKPQRPIVRSARGPGDTGVVIPLGEENYWKEAPPLGRSGTGGLGDIFASFLEHAQGAFNATSDDESASANLLRKGTDLVGGGSSILDQRQADAIRQYNEATPFWEEPTTGESIAGGIGAIGGGLAGSVLDPISMIGGKGATLLSTVLQNAGAGGAADAISQIFTKDLPTQYDPNSEVYDPNTQDFVSNGPAYKAPGFDAGRVLTSAAASGVIAPTLTGQLPSAIMESLKPVGDFLDGITNTPAGPLRNQILPKIQSIIAGLRSKPRDGVGPTSPDAAATPEEMTAAFADPQVLAILQANGIAPDDPRIAQALSAFAPEREPSANPSVDPNLPLGEVLAKRVANAKVRASQAPKTDIPRTEEEFRGAPKQSPEATRFEMEKEAQDRKALEESLNTGVDQRTGKPFNPGFDPRVGQTPNDPIGTLFMGQQAPKPGERFEQVPIQGATAPVTPPMRVGTRAQGAPVGRIGEGAKAGMEAHGFTDISPEERAELKAAWGFVPDTVETRRAALKSLVAEKARQAKADAEGALRVSDTSGSGVGRTDTDEDVTLTSPASRPMQRPNAKQPTDANIEAGEAGQYSRSASGRGDRPFRAEDSAGADTTPSGKYNFDLEAAVRAGDAEAGFKPRTQAQEFEAKARADYEQARKESLEDLEAFWEYQKAKRERDAGARAEYEARNKRAEEKYSDTKPSSEEKGFDADGRYETDESGFVRSKTGGIITFTGKDRHVKAGKWIINAQKNSLDQNFERHNHPTVKDAITVREFSRTSKPKSDGGANRGTGEDANAKSARSEQANTKSEGAGKGNADAAEGVSRDGAKARSGRGADKARDSDEDSAKSDRPLSIEHRTVEKTNERRAAEDAEAQLERTKKSLAEAREKVKAAEAKDETPETIAEAEKHEADVKRFKAERDAQAAKLKTLKEEAAKADAAAKEKFKAESTPKKGIPEHAKSTNPPHVESFFGFDKRPISKDDLTDDGYPKAFGEPAFGETPPKAKSGNTTTKFHSNPIFDPEVMGPAIKNALSAIGKLFARTHSGLAKLRHRLRQTSSIVSAVSDIEDWLRWFFTSNQGMIKTFTDRYRGLGLEDVAKGLEKIESRIFTKPGEGGENGITSESWQEAIEPVVNQTMTKVANILDPVAKLGDDSLKKFALDYQFNRAKMLPEHREVATRLQRVLDDFHKDVNARLKALSDARIAAAKTPEERAARVAEAENLKVGYIQNYLPRMLDMEKLVAEGGEEAFVAAAKKEFMREYSMNAVEAQDAAQRYYDRASGITFDYHISNTTKADSMKSRVLKGHANSELNKFYLDSPVEALYGYVHGMTRSLARMERFGVNNEIIEQELSDLARKGLTQADKAYVIGALNSTMGLMPTTLNLGMGRVAGIMRMLQSLRFLDQSTLSSLAEPMMAAARTGRVSDAVLGMVRTVRQLVGGGKAEEVRMLSEGLGITMSALTDAHMANKFVGYDFALRSQRRLSANFFKAIGLHQYTQASRQATTETAVYFLGKTLQHYKNGYGKESARLALADLGISEEMAPKIMKLLEGEKGLPRLSTIMANTPEAKAYRTAINRMVNESIMNPNPGQKPAWANTPSGSLFFGIASFNAAFTRNVLFRTAKQIGGTISGVASGKMGLVDVYRRTAGPAISLGLAGFAQGLVGIARDQLYNPEQAAQRTDEQKAALMFSRAGFLGNLDKTTNSILGVKYEQSILNAFAGPALSTLARDFETIVLKTQGYFGNKENNNNTAEWRRTKALYENLTPFIIGGLVSAGAKAPLPVRAGLGLWLLSPYSPGAPQTAVNIANAIEGKRKRRPVNAESDDRLDDGLDTGLDTGLDDGLDQESAIKMPSLISSANAGELEAPAKSSRKRKYVISRAPDGSILAGSGNSVYSIRKDKDGKLQIEER